MKHFSYLLFLLLSIFIFSCNNGKPIIEKNGTFDMQDITFQEDVPILYSKKQAYDNGMPYNVERDGPIPDSLLRYRINDFFIDLAGAKMPQKEFGFNYKSVNTDSITRFGETYFSLINTLTDLDHKPVAFYAQSKVGDKNKASSLLRSLKEKYGEPAAINDVDDDFDVCYYQWDLEDRTIQLETSKGFTSSSDYPNGQYIKIELLIINNKSLDMLCQAHIFHPEDAVDNSKDYFASDEFTLYPCKQANFK